MQDLIKLETLDVDGAIRETAEDAAGIGIDRSQFLKRAAGAGAGFVAGGVLFGGLASPASAAISTRRKSKANDVKILNYALTLEYLEAEFYRAALAGGGPNTDQLKAFAQATSAHEDAHVKTLKQVLGSAAVKKPSFDFGDTVTDPAKFAATAQALEDTGVAAYAGQGPNIAQRAVVQAALSIHSVEARHAAWIRFINSGGAFGANGPAPRSFDSPKSERSVLKVVTDTGFLKG
ncbi:ferritin-like domain-containing protein [Conexibacter sp. SYSU D00693]|uniref:ferritin-like domain-containing protein n=1 Tax=Conexibacter sp. SYSU D00693 TaxID=2812560 RepID=UPI00196B66D8|nr:ferritin-like domain-containing protein [Conexibacter sp. SYSU D00693]